MTSSAAVRIFAADPRERASWFGLADIAEVMPTGWSLAGGSLVRLHLQERRGGGGRATRDVDLILDVRAEPTSIRRMSGALRRVGFAPDGMNPSEQHHRWSRGDAQIDVLTPDFLGPRLLDRRHPGFGRLLPTRGAQLGLDRTEAIPVEVVDRLGLSTCTGCPAAEAAGRADRRGVQRVRRD